MLSLTLFLFTRSITGHLLAQMFSFWLSFDAVYALVSVCLNKALSQCALFVAILISLSCAGGGAKCEVSS